jgi:hypothetical protein|tara:strand:- start:21 stop:254 length:234 start_codon:yes stop_codon:yes gene_type:complete
MTLERERPPHKITYVESARLNLSLHHSKDDLKKRWSEISSDERRALREEWGEYLNESYPFEVGNDDEFIFLDSFKSW